MIEGLKNQICWLEFGWS